MASRMRDEFENSDVRDWWSTSIIDMSPGRIEFRGRSIESLIGNVSFVQMIWWLAVGEELDVGRARLLEAALVSAADHGPQAPSIASARMAMTCGVGINSAMANGVNALGDIHGGAGQQALTLYTEIDALVGDEPSQDEIEQALGAQQKKLGSYLPGFGHRFHPVDPRAPRLMALVDEAVAGGVVGGRFAKIAKVIEIALENKRGKPVPMNIDGATAVIYAELGCPPVLARGLFCLSRSVGIMAHAHEQHEQQERIKGPTPPHYLWRYRGKKPKKS